MGKKSTYCNLHKSKRNKRSQAAKLRWSKKIDNSVSHNSPHLFGIFDEERHKFDQWNNQREGESANSNLSDSFANQCPQSVKPKELDTLNDHSPELTVNPNLCLKKYIPHHFIKDKEYGTISSDECERISNYPLTTEKCSKSSVITGNRIVELGYVIDQVLQLQYEHCQICTPGKIYIRNEIRKGKGFISTILLQCNQCTKTFEIETENPKTPVSVINTGAVWGTVATGSTYDHMEEQFSCMDIPVISKSMFYSLEEKISVEWKSAMWRSMEAAGIKEKQFAISQQQFSTDKTPLITVYVDGSWSKRSYGTNYNSLSGMVGIIGRHTGEILYIGVRNRFCSICARAEHKKQQPKVHICYKNWTESAQAMEADMVVEGFNFSQEMHGVKYGKFIGDGDSSVFAKIKQNVTYGHEVQKIECTNHVLKNYGKHLRAIKKDMQINSEGRKLLTINVIEKLTKRAKSSIYEHAKADKNVSLLREDLENGLLHIFGDHTKCREGICNTVGSQTESKILQLKSTTIYHHLKGALNLLIRKAHLLLENENNNRAERLMNIVARFNMGKRLNLVQRGSYENRVYLSGLRHNKASNWYSSPWKRITERSPGQHFKRFISRFQMNRESKTRRRLFSATQTPNLESFSTETPNLQMQTKRKKKVNTDYGPNAEQPPEEMDIVLRETNHLLESLQVTPEERARIEELSIGQFGNAYYELERRFRLTASIFGRVIKRKPYTPCHGIVKSCLQSNRFYSKATEYGIAKEEVAINLFQSKMEIKVYPSGLWVDLNHGFLGASPDGITTDDCVVEVKCIYLEASVMVRSINELIGLKKKLKKPLCLEEINGIIRLKRTHSYYYQIQGQLNITGKSRCYFIVYVTDSIELFVEVIKKDSELWNNVMLPKLLLFYKECIAPEIYRRNLEKGQKCVDPPFITEAIQARTLKKTQQPTAKKFKKNCRSDQDDNIVVASTSDGVTHDQ